LGQVELEKIKWIMVEFTADHLGHFLDGKGLAGARRAEDANAERPLKALLADIGVHDRLQGQHRPDFRRIGGTQMADIEHAQISEAVFPAHLFLQIVQHLKNDIHVAGRHVCPMRHRHGGTAGTIRAQMRSRALKEIWEKKTTTILLHC
ncbi:MAG: hypothetical protein UV42_C0043G0001, partial [Candidatus Magasanikbacteria bacterium GW2011_GWE2_42_7]